jgi:DNA mismatch repair protein MutS
LPAGVVDRAEEVLSELEAKAQENGRRKRGRGSQQLTLFGEVTTDGIASRVLDEVLGMDVTTMTPLEALTRLAELQGKARGG